MSARTRSRRTPNALAWYITRDDRDAKKAIEMLEAAVGISVFLHHRLGHAMSNTQRLTERQRPAGTNNLLVAWETLTHAANPR